MDEADLSPEQTEKLLQFQDLTGIEDMSECRSVLERYEWNLEAAVQSIIGVERLRENRPVYDDGVSPYRPTGWFQWGYYVITLPIRAVYNTLKGILTLVLQLIRPDHRRMVTDPRGDVMKFRVEFEASYGLLHPPFFDGSYSQALNEARRGLKFLLAYLHCEDHQDSDEFCRTVLCDRDVTEFIRERMIMWACSVTSPEGYRVSQALRENTYPFLAVVVQKDNRMTVVARIEGRMSKQKLMERLQTVINDNEASLIAARADREERDYNQVLRQQQDEAYEQSLRADQEKERRRRELREQREKEEQEMRDRELAEQRRKEDIQQQKLDLVDAIPPEPASTETGAIHVVVKLPHGGRLERRFLHTHSLKFLYYYIFCHPDSPDEFEVTTNFPRCLVPCQPTDECPHPPTFEEAGYHKSEMFFVRDLEA